MNTKQSMLLSGVMAFMGGFIAGWALSTEKGKELRRNMSAQAHQTSNWMETRLHHIEDRIHRLEGRLHQASEGFAEKVKDATERATEHLVPTPPEEWDVESNEVTRELRRLPRP